MLPRANVIRAIQAGLVIGDAASAARRLVLSGSSQGRG